MTDEDKKLIFEYMGWNFIDKCRLDGNDMVEAMNKMVEKGEWDGFSYFAYHDKGDWKQYDKNTRKVFIPWLLQPNRFFELLSEALEKGVIGK